jgi:hypothetical protein
MSSPSLRRLLLALFLLTALIVGPAAALLAQPRPFVTANGVVLQQNQTLPVFSLQGLQVNPELTSGLSQRFDGIYSRQSVGSDEYRGLPRYTMPNTTTLSLLTQYGATGGFNAFDLREIGRETPRGEVDTGVAEFLACRFLVLNSFMDGQGNLLLGPQTPQGVSTPNPFSCDFGPGQGPGYLVRTIQGATLPANTPDATPNLQTLGATVLIPMSVPVNQQRSAVPLGGPGGHISLLFSTTASDKGNTLDSSVPGLSAVAMPFFGRSLSPLRDVPVRDPAQVRKEVEDQVRSSYPGATAVNVPQPELFYYVDEPGVPQQTMEPVLNFPGIEVTVGGETIVLRDVSAPLLSGGAGGFGPTVSITAPANGSLFEPGAQVDLQGQISDGQAPYSYEWLAPDGTSLAPAATLDAAGGVQLKTSALPVLGKDGLPQPTSVTLRVTDDEGAVREAVVSLTPSRAPVAYLPLVATNATGGTASIPAALVAAPAAELAQSGFSFGVEANWDYPPYGAGGSDLPGVVPDANGMRSGMLSYGYSQRFYWSNASAWEKDWRDCGLGGIDCTFGVDRADYVYYAGHGGAGGLAMASNKDSTWFAGSNARYQTLRWAGFASCQTLRVQGYAPPSEPIRQWFGAFRGAHLLTGFNSNMADVAFGGPLMSNMRMPSFFGIDFPWAQQTIAQAWVSTAFALNAGKPAYIYAVGTNGVNPISNKLPKPGSSSMPPRPFPVASYHWVWWNE